ncbi:MAG TPA: hypothetical protein VGI15_05110, partial [Candidatus Cybelea sp.]
YEYYDRENGIAVYAAPSVKPGKAFVYFDPVDRLGPQAQARWAHGELAEQMIQEAVRKAGAGDEQLVVA